MKNNSINVFKLRENIPKDKDVILFVDFYNMFLRNFHAVSMINKQGEHIGGVFGTLRNLHSLIDLFRPSEVYIISDGPNSSIRRKLMDKEYKANRNVEWKPGIVKAYDFLNEKEHKENFSKQIKRLREYFDILPIKWLSLPYVEADDVIAELASLNSGKISIICSTDKDYNQLVNNEIFCYNPASKKLLTDVTFSDHYDFLPDNYIYVKAIQGDKSDNIDGIPKIGEKTFLKLFPESKNKKIKTLEDLLEIAHHNLNFGTSTKSIKEKYEKIIENKDLLKKNIKMMQLSDVDISLQSKRIIKEFFEKNPHKLNKNKLRIMFIQDQFEENTEYFVSSFIKLEFGRKK